MHTFAFTTVLSWCPNIFAIATSITTAKCSSWAGPYPKSCTLLGSNVTNSFIWLLYDHITAAILDNMSPKCEGLSTQILIYRCSLKYQGPWIYLWEERFLIYSEYIALIFYVSNLLIKSINHAGYILGNKLMGVECNLFCFCFIFPLSWPSTQNWKRHVFWMNFYCFSVTILIFFYVACAMSYFMGTL